MLKYWNTRREKRPKTEGVSERAEGKVSVNRRRVRIIFPQGWEGDRNRTNPPENWEYDSADVALRGEVISERKVSSMTQLLQRTQVILTVLQKWSPFIEIPLDLHNGEITAQNQLISTDISAERITQPIHWRSDCPRVSCRSGASLPTKCPQCFFCPNFLLQ